MKDFIKIQNERIRKNTIKKYQPFGEKKLNLYYNTSRYKIELQVFDFDSVENRNDALETLDLEFGV